MVSVLFSQTWVCRDLLAGPGPTTSLRKTKHQVPASPCPPTGIPWDFTGPQQHLPLDDERCPSPSQVNPLPVPSSPLSAGQAVPSLLWAGL